MTAVEFRIRSERVPAELFPQGEVRIYLGDASTKRERAVLVHRREVLRKLARRGQWDVLRGIRDQRYTVEEVVRIVDESGVDTLHMEIRDPGAGEPLGEMVQTFLASIEVEKTRAAYETDLNRLLTAVGADTSWDRVGRHEVNDLLDAMRRKGLSPNTRAGAKTAWSAFYTWAIDRDESMAEQQERPARMASHPVRKAKKVKTATTRHRWLTPEELDRLLEVSSPPMRAQYLTLAYTGMRIGEFITRRPEEVDLPRRIRILPREGWAPKGYPGYDHGVRDIPIHRARLLPALERYREEWAGDRTFFVNPRTVEPWTHESFRQQLKRDLEAAGLIYGRKHPDGVVPHTFRHTLGSWLAQEDVQLLKIARILGDTVAIVVKYYAHLLPSNLDETLNEALEW